MDTQTKINWLASIVDSSFDAIIGKDLNGVIASWNPAASQIFGYTEDEIIGERVNVLIPEDRQDEEAYILNRITSGEKVKPFHTIRRRKDGSLIDVSLTISPIRSAAGEIVGASKIAREITDQKRAEERMQILARESNHRANNLLSIFQAIVHQTKSDSVDRYRNEILERLRALATANKFADPDDRAARTFREIAGQQLRPYMFGQPGRVRFSGEDAQIGPEEAEGIMLILHELATNALKYGALSRPEGYVELLTKPQTNEKLLITWSEYGGPTVHPPTRRGFGSTLIEAISRIDLCGDLTYHWKREGLVCSFTIDTSS